MRVFLDTNVLVSAIASTSGLCAEILRQILLSYQLIISAPLINELENILKTKLKLPDKETTDFLEFLMRSAVQAKTFTLEDIEINDTDDIIIISSALGGKADYFVTGDKELLAIERIHSMRIISPRKFWETFKIQPLL